MSVVISLVWDQLMPTTTKRNRVQKIDEAKEIIASLEAEQEMRLATPRAALHDAGKTIGHDRVFFEHMEKAMGRTAGLAVEGGYDEVAADASELVTDLQENALNGE